ncbi:MAG: PTS sugar transporter subunit IIA [Deltaproteobacteria bacterium]|nr:PTS sugar transporter subunit IIA [Deltaproteobacteria bacterium]
MEILKETNILPELKGKKKEDVINELIAYLYQQKLIPDEREALRVVFEREKLGSTGIGDGVAIPHGKLSDIERLICVLGISKEGIDFEAVDGKPVHLIFLILAPAHKLSLHLEALSKISKILKNGILVKKIIKTTDAKKIYQLIKEEEYGIKNERE